MKRSFLFLLLVAAALAQTESQIESDEVKRVGSHLTCRCGACSENLNCMMSAGQCHFCKPARTKIFKMQQAGMNDQSIIATFVKTYGPDIFRRDPNNSFWIVPYVILVAGVVLIWFVLRRWRGQAVRHTASGPPAEDDPQFRKYRESIEKDMARLE